MVLIDLSTPSLNGPNFLKAILLSLQMNPRQDRRQTFQQSPPSIPNRLQTIEKNIHLRPSWRYADHCQHTQMMSHLQTLLGQMMARIRTFGGAARTFRPSRHLQGPPLVSLISRRIRVASQYVGGRKDSGAQEHCFLAGKEEDCNPSQQTKIRL